MAPVTKEELGSKTEDILQEVEKGREVLITAGGRPVAKIVKVNSMEDEGPFVSPEVAARRAAAMQEMLAFRKLHPLNGITIRELIEEGRRY